MSTLMDSFVLVPHPDVDVTENFCQNSRYHQCLLVSVFMPQFVPIFISVSLMKLDHLDNTFNRCRLLPIGGPDTI